MPKRGGSQYGKPMESSHKLRLWRKTYQVYRFRHPGETDHTGNREWRGGIFKTKAEAQALADELNDAEGGNNETGK